MFEILSTSSFGRRGRITTRHGVIESPFFMPVGTAGAMRGMTLQDLEELQAQILLCNTYHLHIQPGEETVASAGGLHPFIGWDKPILTDSGGFQVFSLRSIRHVTDEGVSFHSHRNGSPLFLGPTEAIDIQWKLGSDIIMNFDECPPSTASRQEIERAVDRTLRWAKVCKVRHEEHKAAWNEGRKAMGMAHDYPPLLFGIIQGGLHRDLRKKCAEELIAIGFDGYAVGGLAVGESESEMMGVLDDLCPILPVDKPRYLMGVGVLHQLKACVERGIDMFDCVLPMRIARHGTILLSDGTDIRIKNSRFATAHEPIDADSPSILSRHHSKSYLHHLFALNERSAETIACKQNLGVTLAMMRELRSTMDRESPKNIGR